MTTINRLTVALAILTMITSVPAIRRLPPVRYDTDPSHLVGQPDPRLDRYYSESSAVENGPTLLQPTISSGRDEFSARPANWSGRFRDSLFTGTPSKSKQSASDEPGGTGLGVGKQVHYTASLSSSPESDGVDGVVQSKHDRVDAKHLREDYFFPEDSLERNDDELSNRERRNRSNPLRDPDESLAPELLPLDEDKDPAIDEILTGRYQNPMTIRAIRAMSSDQAVQLYSEVSQKIDERSLTPTSYSVRVRRSLRNLQVALDNEAFLNGLGFSGDAFQREGFRNALIQLANTIEVYNYRESLAVLKTVMREAQEVAGLTPSVVGFEFTNASLDTLDKFSGLDLEEPMSRNGTENQDLIRTTDAIDEHIVGIGLEVHEHPEGLIVVRPIRGGPAAESGIVPGDIIHSINDQDLRGMRLGSSIDLLKGPAGSQMKLHISRDGQSELELSLTRRTVRVWTVNDLKMLNASDVGYFSLSRFSQNSPAEVDQALDNLYSQGMKSLIIDVRGNPGGLLTTCVEISDEFVACGTIVSTKGRLSSDDMILKANYSSTWRVPVVVLIDSNSASASEIFASAIQENKRGVIVGTRSYGKGTVQTHFPLSSIAGDLRLTTAEFYSPTGRRMAGEGVTPDIEVDDHDGVRNGDEVLAEAIRIARSPVLKDMAKEAGACRSQNPPTVRSSSLDDISDPSHPWTTIL